ncbi:MAG: hypothetical protein RIE86_09240 [Imperialibacter sp.]|uniref:hypothetical protein n=1 Tax=Imperialibacter sp. TaxID=2038411 RepID=UPI0032ED947C
MKPFIYQKRIALPTPAQAKDLREGDQFKTKANPGVAKFTRVQKDGTILATYGSGTLRLSPSYPIYKLIFC